MRSVAAHTAACRWVVAGNAGVAGSWAAADCPTGADSSVVADSWAGVASAADNRSEAAAELAPAEVVAAAAAEVVAAAAAEAEVAEAAGKTEGPWSPVLREARTASIDRAPILRRRAVAWGNRR